MVDAAASRTSTPIPARPNCCRSVPGSGPSDCPDAENAAVDQGDRAGARNATTKATASAPQAAPLYS